MDSAVPPSDSEELAQRIVEAALPDARLEYRECQHGGGSLRHDFWLHRVGTTPAALEVTSVRDEDRVRTQSKLQRNRHKLSAEKCEWTWRVEVDPEVVMSTVEANIDSYLAELEAGGIQRFPVNRRPPELSPGSDLLLDLSVVSAHAAPEVQPPTIYIHVYRPGTWVSANVVYDALRAPIEDNAEKLSETDAPERHLFVWLDPEESSGTVMPFTSPQEVEPDLPRGVTHIWVAAPDFRREDRASYLVWRAGQGEPWSSLGSITVDER